MKGRTFGYARVSTTDQHLDRQIEALTSYGVAERDIITDKFSGKDFNRQGYLALKDKMLRRGDVLVVKELDRLGRNYEQIKEEWQELQKMGVDIVIIDMPILNTAEKSDLEKSLIANIVFELLAYTAEKERQKIKLRQREGIDIALQKGIPFGRPKKAIPDNFFDECRKWLEGEQTAVITMKKTGLKKTTFYRMVNENMREISVKC
ncbi:MAG: recombinase family protein [Ruminiclostridium sp.]|nr:recombinase family protein [Ruminiclostridium sp.]